MTAYETISGFIASGRGAGFDALDGEGHGVSAADPGLPVNIYADPGDGEGDPFVLYVPLLSLVGADEKTQNAFLWRLAYRNTVGSLPLGHSLFADPEDLGIYLGAQFSPERLEAPVFEAAAAAFADLARYLRGELGDFLQEAAKGGDAGAPSPGAPVNAESADPQALIKTAITGARLQRF
jgi:hypothetical protein